MGQYLYLRAWVLCERPLVVLMVITALVVSIHHLGLERNNFGHRHYSGSRKAAPGFRPAIVVPRLFRDWREQFQAAAAPQDPEGLVRGIFLGSTQAIQPEVNQLFRDAGLSHLVAASGYNCWIVAVAFSILFRLLVSAARGRLTSWFYLWTRVQVGPVAGFCGAWLFWLWTDQSPPITRCVVTISARYWIEAMAIRVSFARLLLVQYLVSLLVMPRLWQSASFQLTFGCLFGIVLFPRWIAHWAPPPRSLGRSIWDYFATGLGACLGTLPTTWLLFGSINFSGLLTNWFAVPIVSFAVMPLSLALMLTVPSGIPWLSDTFAAAAGASAWVLLVALRFWTTHVPSLQILML